MTNKQPVKSLVAYDDSHEMTKIYFCLNLKLELFCFCRLTIANYNFKQKFIKQKFEIEIPVSSNKAIINKNYLNSFYQLGISSEFRRIIFACSQHFACTIFKDLLSFTHTAFNASIVRISEFEQLQKLLTATSSWIEN